MNNTNIFETVKNGNLQGLINYLEHGTDVNDKSLIGETILHYAVYFNNLEIVNYLIGHGANINSRDFWNWTPLHNAARYKSIEIAIILL